MSEQTHGEHRLHLTIIVDGIPQKKEYSPNEKVEEVIKSLLSPGQRQNWDQYILTEQSTRKQLDSSQSLTQNGVKDGDVLALTKKEGGGGFN